MAPHICKGVLIRFGLDLIHFRMVVNQEFEHAKAYLNCNTLCDQRGVPTCHLFRVMFVLETLPFC
jgi:hypothetical protein